MINKTDLANKTDLVIVARISNFFTTILSFALTSNPAALYALALILVFITVYIIDH